MDDDSYSRKGIESQPILNTTFLSERDLSLTVPINFVNTPGVSLTSVCLSQNNKTSADFKSCLGKLLATGFRRIEIDLYWDNWRNLFSFCPVIALTSLPEPVSSQTSTFISLSTHSANSSLTTLVSSSDQAHPSTPLTPSVITPSPLVLRPSVVKALNQSSTSTDSLACPEDLDLKLFTTQLLYYLRKTDNVLEAHLLYIIINLHAATFTNATNSSETIPSGFPEFRNLVGQSLSLNLSAYFYTPADLKSDRANLNDSWYKVNSEYQTTSDYYVENTDEDGIVSTEDGWPGESYIEFALGKRILLGWGTVDSQMSLYNFSGDSDIIFPMNYLRSRPKNIEITSTGEVIEGCFLQNDTQEVSLMNSSWATQPVSSSFENSSNPNDFSFLLKLASNLSNCGISPLLNDTPNITVENPIPYSTYKNSTNWAWAVDEPRNYVRSSEKINNSSSFRCATTNLALSGHWTVSNCSDKYFGACRATGEPYKWAVSSDATSFHLVDAYCPEGYVFAAPRTGLENAFLTQEMRRTERNWGEDVRCWVAFDSLKVENCWVVGAKNNSCPYVENDTALDTLRKRTLLIPTIVALLVIVLTVITLCTKAAGNRAERRRPRRNPSVVYEGVPG
ncbi:Maintenance of telomere capping protein 6 [Golovinomyces cichoracearum]|uniref:Maintenance of telomere capping protein 6 n=1 Tax=Golovinomyces cichoracearum TaxID=62708 RepID=A0A420IFS0_9PEZI|nr:Maintenance of telomere capping protein 6 [Golovinomyces cichoracearum]